MKRGVLTDRIGNTPLVRLQSVVAGRVRPDVEVWAKLESFNPGGSVKDRAAWSILRAMEASGRLVPGMRLLDSSSGNTGIAYGMIAASRGHALTLCLPRNANLERKKILRAYGVEVIETDPLEGSDGAIRAARALAAAHPDRYLYLDQYGNAANWRAHYETTAPEIWRDTGGRVTHWVAGLGTTGTFVGTTRRLREFNPRLYAASVEPDSPFHGLEGLKHLDTAIRPGIYDDTLASERLAAPTEEALALARRLAREEGILAGPSCGAALWGALEVAARLEQGVVVTLFPDSGERYLSQEHLWA
jgi:cysteine synthase B